MAPNLTCSCFSRILVRFNEKMTKHGEGYGLACMVFFPMVVDTFGGLEQSAVMQLKKFKIGHCIGQTERGGGV